ncbi:elicitor-responsive protein 3-like [Vigna unguiculata]|uniref:elicitor-responsive protein 3-like n=1 Tax=Vigna unguiculata TaxID=3917 RepID=UPI0010169901|nr:elicitor-responsive protein 3-like [Vigna unguiculata]
MKRGILEVLVVNAKGIIHTNFVGTPSYYVIIECGTQTRITKVSSGKHEKPRWNEKFIFDLSESDCKNSTYLKCRIMDTELFRNGGFVGEAKIFIGGIILEGSDQGYIEIQPAPYNVVLQDHTYKGQIKIGFKFIADNNEEYLMEKPDEFKGYEKKESPNSIFGWIWRISLWKILFFYQHKTSKSHQDYH